MFERPDSRLFKREYVDKAEYYFEKFGPAKAVVLARFIPIVRTFLNPVAGTLGMPARKFLLWNIVGAILWTDGVLLLGYLLAQQIYDAIGDKIDHYILPVVALIVLISVLPILIEIIRERRAKKRAPRAEATSRARPRRSAWSRRPTIAGLAEASTTTRPTRARRHASVGATAASWPRTVAPHAGRRSRGGTTAATDG